MKKWRAKIRKRTTEQGREERRKSIPGLNNQGHKKNKAPGTFRPGDRVWHRFYGMGNILEEWGTFLACPECTKILLCHVCKDCNRRATQVGGTGIYDILFKDGKTRSINEHWLTPLGKLAAPRTPIHALALSPNEVARLEAAGMMKRPPREAVLYELSLAQGENELAAVLERHWGMMPAQPLIA